MSIGAERARGAVRLSLGAPTTREEIGHAAAALITAWRSTG
jgi:cysteine sulfinate desulfinase/cysteine desulfurase-like protein